MKRRKYTLAALFLLVAISAVASASMRAAIVGDLSFTSPHLDLREITAAAIFGGAVIGTVFGSFLAVWNRSDLPAAFGSVLGGLFLGAAAGAQCTVKVEWPVIFSIPIVLISGAAVVAVGARRRLKARDTEGVRSPI